MISLYFSFQRPLFPLPWILGFFLIYFIIKEHFYFRTVASPEDGNPFLKFRFAEFDTKEIFLISFSQKSYQLIPANSVWCSEMEMDLLQSASSL